MVRVNSPYQDPWRSLCGAYSPSRSFARQRVSSRQPLPRTGTPRSLPTLIHDSFHIMSPFRSVSEAYSLLSNADLPSDVRFPLEVSWLANPPSGDGHFRTLLQTIFSPLIGFSDVDFVPCGIFLLGYSFVPPCINPP